MFDRSFVAKFDSIVARGFSHGVGAPGKQVCVEAAVCEALGLPHGDNPSCVGAAVRAAKIRLNDSRWSSPEARAKGLRDVGIAQLGSDGLDQAKFSRRLAEKTIRRLIPALFRKVMPGNAACQAAADRCEREGTRDAATAAAYAATAAAYAADAAANAAYAADADAADEWLRLGASLVLEVLREMNCPGVALLEG